MAIINPTNSGFLSNGFLPNWVPAPCLRLAGAGYNMQGFGQADFGLRGRMEGKKCAEFLDLAVDKDI